MSSFESDNHKSSVESSGPESAVSRGLRREVIHSRIPDGYSEDQIGRVESNIRFFQSNCSGLAFDDLLDLMNGGTGSLDGLYHDDDLLREGKIDLEALQLLFGVMQYAGEPEDEAAKLAYIGYHHYCTEDEDDRKFPNYPEGYRLRQLRVAIERFDLGKWHRWRRRENADGFDEEDYRNWTDDYSDVTYDILVALVRIGCGEVNPADAARLYEIDLPESSIVLENLYNGEYREIPSSTKIGPVSNSIPYRDSRGYRYVPPKAVIEAAGEVDGRSERTYKNALCRLRQRGVLKWAEIEEGVDYRIYPSMLPDPPDANRIKFEGEEYRPEATSPSVDSKLMTDGGVSEVRQDESARTYPYRDKETLRRLYWDEEMSAYDIANELECAPGTILRWMAEYDIPRRDRSEAVEISNHLEAARETSRKNRLIDKVPYGIKGGYEFWKDTIAGEEVRVSQLLAIADGADPYEVFDEETVCHHTTHHPRDNRPDVIEVLTRSEHTSYHQEQTIPDCKRELLDRIERTESATEDGEMV